MRAYWFSREDGTTEHQSVAAVVGRTDTFDGAPVPCECGLHASPTPFDALGYACGARLWAVEIPEDAVPHGNPVDKYACKSRTYLRSVDLRPVLIEFSCRQAEGILHLYEQRYPNDDRPRKAIEMARRHAAGKATNEELAVAREAAGEAAGAAEAAWAARAATWAAAEAAWAAAWAAWAATREAAWEAAWATAREAAWAAAWAATGQMFNEMAIAALEGMQCTPGS